MSRAILFFGGNGHAASRLTSARRALRQLGNPFVLREIAYPGFEGRSRVSSFEDFLIRLAPQVEDLKPTLIHATGIGGLIALCLRTRDIGVEIPMLLQAPILWGLEHRWFPTLMRLGFARLLPPLFRLRWFQRRFVRKHFVAPLDDQRQVAFFEGYQHCSAMLDFFHWLTPGLLRDLEQRFAEFPVRRDNVRVWWGSRDSVVTLAELHSTPKAIRGSWPVREFPSWGHYPMIETPNEWIEALRDELATIEPIPKPGGAEAR